MCIRVGLAFPAAHTIHSVIKLMFLYALQFFSSITTHQYQEDKQSVFVCVCVCMCVASGYMCECVHACEHVCGGKYLCVESLC